MEDKPRGLTAHTLARVLTLDRAELPAALWSWLYFFCILSGYYILRPLRDEMGLAGGIRNIPWLWTGTLTVMLVAHPLFTKLVAKLPRAIFIGFIYRFFAVNLLAFFVLLTLSRGAAHIWIGRIFYGWTSVFNLFVVSVFWALMVDSFRSDEGKRVFGFIALGGTLGAVVGAGTTALLATVLGPVNLILIAIVMV
ncbi:MAG: MFS transporter, partial [Acidobacteriota bacterium]